MRFYTFVFVLLWGTIVWAQGFLPATDDIPLMDGLYQVEETATFDSPAEKMTIISALSTKNSAEITRFYRQVLVNLGWTAQKNNHYIRATDTLTIEITPGKETIIQFTLVQKN